MMQKALVLSVLWLLPMGVSAHNLPYTAINTELDVNHSFITLRTELGQDVSGFYYLGENGLEDFYERYFSNNLVIAQSGERCGFSLAGLRLENSRTVFEGRYACSREIYGIGELEIVNKIFAEEFVAYDHFVSLRLGGQEWELVFDKQATDFPAQVRAEAGFSHLRFAKLGLEHIFTGYDHMLFVLMLILMLRSPRKMLLLVTAFTLAHSLTLFLSALDIFRLPTALVEPLIALSIGYVAYRNIGRLTSPSIPLLGAGEGRNAGVREKWVTSFGFGLVHGLGFAGALAETPIPRTVLIPAVLSFNLGIELGQFAIIALASPLLYLLHRSPHNKKIALAISVTTLLFAVYLVIERLI